MAPAVKLPLPAGKLGIVFHGTPPAIKRISEDSPIYGKVKPGYVFEALFLSDGTVFEGLTTHELVTTLSEYADEEGRKLKVKMGLPDRQDVTLPGGDIGITIKEVDGMATITKVSSKSPLKSTLRAGMVIEKVMLEDGYTGISCSAEEVTEMLSDDLTSSSRVIGLMNPKMSMPAKSVVFPKKKEVELPTGKLGVSFKSKEFTKVASLSAASPLRGSFRIGMVVDSLIFPDGTEMRGLDAKDLTEAIKYTAEYEGRKMLLKSPEAKDLPTVSSTKVFLPTDGNASELGLAFAGTPAVIKEVSETSPVIGKCREGQMVLQMGLSDGTEYDDLDADELEDVFEDSSGTPGRFLILKNLPQPLPNVKTITLPAGKIGAVFKGTPPSVIRVNDDSPIKSEGVVGMVVDTLKLESGETMYELETPEFTAALAANSSSDKRVVRFINPATMETTKSPEMEMPDEMIVTLPVGKLGVMFKGKAPCVVSSINKTSPLYGEIPAGMSVDSLEVGKLTYIDLDAMELAGVLSATSEISDRVLTLKNSETEGVEFQKLPDSKEIALPSGALGCVFKGNPPVPSSYKDGSQVEGLFPTGMFVDMITLSDGTVMSGLATPELVGILKDTTDETERTILFKNPKTKEPSPPATILPDEKKIILPAGKLGVSFKGRDMAKATRIHDDSVVRGIVRVGMVVDTITLPNGTTYAGLTAKECSHVLADSRDMEGRVMVLKNPETAEMTKRNIAVDDDDDIYVEGDDASDDITEVSEIG